MLLLLLLQLVVVVVSMAAKASFGYRGLPSKYTVYHSVLDKQTQCIHASAECASLLLGEVVDSPVSGNSMTSADAFVISFAFKASQLRAHRRQRG